MIMGMAVAWEIGLIGGGAALAEEGLIAPAASPQLFASAIVDAARQLLAASGLLWLV